MHADNVASARAHAKSDVGPDVYSETTNSPLPTAEIQGVNAMTFEFVMELHPPMATTDAEVWTAVHDRPL